MANERFGMVIATETLNDTCFRDVHAAAAPAGAGHGDPFKRGPQAAGDG